MGDHLGTGETLPEPPKPARWGWTPQRTSTSRGTGLEGTSAWEERVLLWDPGQEELPICPEDLGLDRPSDSMCPNLCPSGVAPRWGPCGAAASVHCPSLGFLLLAVAQLAASWISVEAGTSVRAQGWRKGRTSEASEAKEGDLNPWR